MVLAIFGVLLTACGGGGSSNSSSSTVSSTVVSTTAAAPTTTLPPTTTTAASKGLTVRLDGNLNYYIANYLQSTCGDSSPGQLQLRDGTGVVLGVVTVSVIAGTSNCSYQGVAANVPARDFYTISLGNQTLGTIAASSIKNNKITISQTTGGNYIVS